MKDFFGNPEQLEELVAYIASQINVPTIGIGGGDAPIGKIDFFEANVAPQDWLACDGTVYNIADYPQLAEHYTAVYGEANHWGGNGTTTFAVPDLRGEFLRGAGNNSHANQGNGAAVGEHQDGTEHDVFWGNGGSNIFFPTNGNDSPVSVNKADFWPSSTLNPNERFPKRVSVSGSIQTSNEPKYYTSRPTNTSFLICVKAVVAGGVYSTEERIGGTWIDGKKWYYKTMDCGVLPNDSSKTIAHGISNLSRCIKLYGYAYSTEFLIHMPLPDSNINSSSSIDGQVALFVYRDNIHIVTKKDMHDYDESYVTICYTKTTD